jgi:predicted DNA-binding transcriptional regulator AlpA
MRKNRTRISERELKRRREQSERDRYLNSREIRDRYGVSQMALWRWLHDPAVAFPAPMWIKKRRYWLEADLIAWERSRAVKAA